MALKRSVTETMVRWRADPSRKALLVTGSKTTESGLPDYSCFYDINLLSEVMNEHYGAQPLPAAA